MGNDNREKLKGLQITLLLQWVLYLPVIYPPFLLLLSCCKLVGGRLVSPPEMEFTIILHVSRFYGMKGAM